MENQGQWRVLLQKIMREYHVNALEAGRILADIVRRKVASGGTGKEASHGGENGTWSTKSTQE